ncbi:MAG: ubiquinol-cytochrome c reductase iron-sulfur subunit [Elusimicrobia bacterium]|nr:ubiquinol-cytochrome c reductase iron-sulfur subunit [Elusimicrobiota bacterium]
MEKETGQDALKVSRRSFLGWAAGLMGAAIAAILGGSGFGYFISPAFKKREEDWVNLGRVDQIRLGVPTKAEFTVRKRDAWMTTERRSSAWILTSNGKDFTVFDPKCTHLGCPYRWDEATKKFLCPCHAAVFDVDGSVVKGPPPRPLDRYPVKVSSGRILILPLNEQRKT